MATCRGATQAAGYTVTIRAKDAYTGAARTLWLQDLHEAVHVDVRSKASIDIFVVQRSISFGDAMTFAWLL